MDNRGENPKPVRALWIAKIELQSLISILRSDGYAVVGPTIQQQAIVYAEIESTNQLPIGWHDAQQPGKYRLQPSENDYVDRVRHWDSCFNVDFGYTAGGTIRSDIRSRYRQWMTHKLASWHDQFDSSGCVGCGRCITWCPVGIDLTEEVAAIRETPSTRRSLPILGQPPSACTVPRSIA